MSNFQLPKITVFDSNGDPVAGAKIFFYITGTSTPLATYSNEANTIANTNPVVCDSAGRAGPIWLIKESTYKVVIKTASDVTIYSQDPVKALGVEQGSSIIAEILPYVTPIQYGADGDGINDEYAEVQEAIDNASLIVDLCGKTFKCDSQLIVPSHRVIQNGTLDFSACTATALIKETGSSLGATVSLSANAAQGATTLTVGATTGFSEGDYILVVSSADVTTSVDQGQIVRIDSILSSTQIRIGEPLDYAYNTANASGIKKITFAENISFKNLKIITDHDSAQNAIHITYGKDVVAQKVTVVDIYSSAFKFETCYDCSIDDCVVTGQQTGVPSGLGVVHITDASNKVSISDVVIDSCATGIYVGALPGEYGPSKNVVIENVNMMMIREYGVAFDSACRNSSLKNSFLSGRKVADSAGIYIAGPEVLVDNTTVMEIDAGIVVRSAASSESSNASYVRILNSTIKGCLGSGIELTADTRPFNYIEIRNNAISNCGTSGIIAEVSDSGTSRGFFIHDNAISNSTSEAVFISCTSNCEFKNVVISGNSFTSSTTAVSLVNCSDTFITNNDVITASVSAIKLVCTISSGTHNISIENLSTSAVTSHVIEVIGRANRLAIKGCSLNSTGGDGLYVHTSGSESISQILVHGCRASATGGHVGFSFVSPSAGIIDSIIVSDCFLVSAATSFLYAQRCNNVIIKDCFSYLHVGRMVDLDYCIVASVLRCRSSSSASLNAFRFSNCSIVNVSGCTSSAGQTSIRATDTSRIRISDHMSQGCTSDSIHVGTCTYLSISNSVIETSTAAAISLNACYLVSFSGLILSGGTYAIYATGLYGASIVGVRAEDFSSNVFNFVTTSRVAIDSCVLRSFTSSGIVFSGTANDDCSIRNTTIIGVILSSSTDCIRFSASGNCSVSGCSLFYANYGIYLNASSGNVANVTVSGNQFTGNITVLGLENGASFFLSDVDFCDNRMTGVTGIKAINGPSNLNITNNTAYVEDAYYESSGTGNHSNILISGNSVRGASRLLKQLDSHQNNSVFIINNSVVSSNMGIVFQDESTGSFSKFYADGNSVTCKVTTTIRSGSDILYTGAAYAGGPDLVNRFFKIYT